VQKSAEKSENSTYTHCKLKMDRRWKDKGKYRI